MTIANLLHGLAMTYISIPVQEFKCTQYQLMLAYISLHARNSIGTFVYSTLTISGSVGSTGIIAFPLASMIREDINDM